jgi:hypothetical protein
MAEEITVTEVGPDDGKEADAEQKAAAEADEKTAAKKKSA